MKRALLAAAVLLLANPLYAVAGVRVVDGDTLVLNGETMRLHGIDAPEAAQVCKARGGKNWACGKAATKHLQKLVQGKDITCHRRDVDRYGRTIAVCEAEGAQVNRAMVDAGLAWSFRKYSSDYNRLENRVKKTGKGIWQARNQPPWEFRAAKWKTAAAPDTNRGKNECNIKGNISGNGRIYHMPWQKYYSKTRITTAKGERWFCDENEARAAGWRKARN